MVYMGRKRKRDASAEVEVVAKRESKYKKASVEDEVEEEGKVGAVGKLGGDEEVGEKVEVEGGGGVVKVD